MWAMIMQKEYVMLLTAYRAAGLRVNTLKDNIEIDVKEMALMSSGLILIGQYITLRSQLSGTILCRK
jgi:hypothetical protein